MTTDSFSVTLNGETLSNGSRCTLVFFDEGGNYIPPYQPVFVQHSAYMANHQVGVRYVMRDRSLHRPWRADASGMFPALHAQILAPVQM